MEITEQERRDMAELLQNDLICILEDIVPNEILTVCCQAVLDRILKQRKEVENGIPKDF